MKAARGATLSCVRYASETGYVPEQAVAELPRFPNVSIHT